MLGKRNVFLVGPMGSGKTAVGKALARLMNAAFYDSDTQIEQRTGVDISFIFEKEGEAGFRQREREAIDALTQRETSSTQQKSRVGRSRNRPLLAEADPTAKLTELMRHRGPLYAEVADMVVPTDGRRVAAVAADILNGLKVRGSV